MCVILSGPRSSFTLDLLLKAERANGDGGGLAIGGDDAVFYRKGIDAQMVWATMADLPDDTQVVAHFRIATVGGKTKALCHPFPLNGSLDIAGECDGVLFHNGHWSGWEEHLVQAALSGTVRIPAGEWSDSRAMAILAQGCGSGYLHFISEAQRIVVLRPGVAPEYYGRWQQEEGLWLSNTSFLWSKTYTYYDRDMWDGDWATYRKDPTKASEAALLKTTPKTASWPSKAANTTAQTTVADAITTPTTPTTPIQRKRYATAVGLDRTTLAYQRTVRAASALIASRAVTTAGVILHLTDGTALEGLTSREATDQLYLHACDTQLSGQPAIKSRQGRRAWRRIKKALFPAQPQA
jgi:hypothetical protein